MNMLKQSIETEKVLVDEYQNGPSADNDGNEEEREVMERFLSEETKE